MCREKLRLLKRGTTPIGSPLRVQGKVNSLYGCCVTDRITPACAGKRRTCKRSELSSKDHPCVCREKSSKEIITLSLIGSPLRVQGKVIEHCLFLVCLRITPACAGKRVQNTTVELGMKDHPCVCREKCHTVFCDTTI